MVKVMIMAFFLLWLQLTGLAWNTRIPADQVHCEAGQISLVVEEQILPVQLFNVTLSEEGQQRACAMVNQAEQVSFEIDDHVEQLYPLPVWLFCDGQLLQRVLVEEGVAQVNIRNPEYAYQAQLEAALSQPVSAASSDSSLTWYSRRRGQLWLAFLSFTIAGLLLIKVMLYRRRRQIQRKS